MKKTKKRISIFLVFCMVLSLFTGIPVQAEESENPEVVNKEYGLKVIEWLDWPWNDETQRDELRTMEKEGVTVPCFLDENNNNAETAIGYADYEKFISFYGEDIWLDYVTEGGTTHVTLEDITVTFLADEEDATPQPVTESVISLNENDNRVIHFQPTQTGRYTIIYNQEDQALTNNTLTIWADYPEVGFYKDGTKNQENLIRESLPFGDGDENSFYMILYRCAYSKLDLENISYKISYWDEENNQEAIITEKSEIEKYLTITEPENAGTLSEYASDYTTEDDYIYKIEKSEQLKDYRDFWLDVTVPKVDVIEDENGVEFNKDDSGREAYYEIEKGIDIQYREKMVGLLVTDYLEWNEETEITSVAKEAEFKKCIDYFRPGISSGICLATRTSEEDSVTEIPITDVKICDSEGAEIFDGTAIENYNNIGFGETIYNSTELKIDKMWQPTVEDQGTAEVQNATNISDKYYNITFKKNGTYTISQTGGEAVSNSVTIKVSYPILGVYRTNEVKENTLINHTDFYSGKEKTVYLLEKDVPQGYTLTNVKVQVVDGGQDNYVSYNEKTNALTINKAASRSFGIVISAEVQNETNPMDKWGEEWFVEVTNKRGRPFIEDHKPHMGYAACFISKDEFDEGRVNYDEGLDPLYFVHGSTIQEVIDILYDTVDKTVENEDGVTFRVTNTGYIHVNMSYIPGDGDKDSSGNIKKDANGKAITYESIATQTQYVTTPFDVYGVQMETGRDPYFATTGEANDSTYFQVAKYQKLGSTGENDIKYICRKDDAAYYAIPDDSLISQYRLGEKITEDKLAELESDYEEQEMEYQTEFRWPELHVDATTEIKINGRFGKGAETEADSADVDLYLGFFEDDAYDIRPQVYDQTYDKSFIGRMKTIACPDSIEEYAGETVTIKGVKLTSNKKVNSTFGEDTAIDGDASANILRDKVVISDNDAMQKIIDGEAVTVSLNVSAIDEQNGALGTEVKTGVKGIQTEIDKLGDAKTQYLDIGLGYKVGESTSSETEGAITETTAEVEISTKLPNTFIEQGSVVGKNEVLVYRYHDGKVDELNATYENGKLTFKTDKFSVYAIAVKSEQKPVTPSASETKLPAKGETITDAGSKAKYTVTTAGKTGGTVTYTKAANSTATNVSVPKTITKDGVTYKVTAIGNNAFSGCSKLKTVSIGGNVTTIGSKAFYKCTALTSITIPAKVTAIGKNAFYGCKKMTKVTIGKGVKTIGASAFSGCSKLKTVSMGANVTTIGDKAFYKCTTLNKVTIPAKVTKIGKQAFYGCKTLKTITIKTTKLTSSKVGSSAFKGIYAKATIKVPKNKLTSYKKILKAKGVGSKAKIKK